jgi:hypothetical protein
MLAGDFFTVDCAAPQPPPTYQIEATVSSDDSGSARNEADKDPIAGIDTSVPHSARIWNYWMGGTDNYPVDREAGDELAVIYPAIVDQARRSRSYIARVVRYLAADAGLRQFLDIGTGLPSHDNTHEVAQRIAPESRIVYVDHDPEVIAHARALLAGNPTGGIDYIEADLHRPGTILDIARTKLDFTRPIALMLMGVLGHIEITDDDSRARSIVNELKAGLPSGSHLSVYDGANTTPDYAEAVRIYNEGGSIPYNLRSPEQIGQLLDGLELIPPGVVQIHQWRPDPDPPGMPAEVDAWGGVARKR